MAVTDSFVAFVLEQLDPLGPIANEDQPLRHASACIASMIARACTAIGPARLAEMNPVPDGLAQFCFDSTRRWRAETGPIGSIETRRSVLLQTLRGKPQEERTFQECHDPGFAGL